MSFADNILLNNEEIKLLEKRNYWFSKQQKEKQYFPNSFSESFFLSGNLPKNIMPDPLYQSIENAVFIARKNLENFSEKQVREYINYSHRLICEGFSRNFSDYNQEFTIYAKDSTLLMLGLFNPTNSNINIDARFLINGLLDPAISNFADIVLSAFILGKIAHHVKLILSTENIYYIKYRWYNYRLEEFQTNREFSELGYYGALNDFLKHIHLSSLPLIDALEALFIMLSKQNVSLEHDIQEQKEQIEKSKQAALKDMASKGGKAKNQAYAQQKEKVIKLWKSGKYKRKSDAALEAEKLGYASFSVAQKYLKNIEKAN